MAALGIEELRIQKYLRIIKSSCFSAGVKRRTSHERENRAILALSGQTSVPE